MKQETETKIYCTERIMLSIGDILSQHELSSLRDAKAVELRVEKIIDGLAIQLCASIWGMPRERLVIDRQWPADWWQATKERWFPAWWLRRWPVRYEKIDLDVQMYSAICPHLSLDTQDKHLRFLQLHAQEQNRIIK